MYCNQAQIAANWWIEQIKKRCSQKYPTKVIAQGSNLVVIDDSFAEQLSRFHYELSQEIQHYLEKNNYLSYTCYIIPNSTLSAIAKKAGLATYYFPYQASMTILNQKVQVSISGEHFYDLPLTTE